MVAWNPLPDRCRSMICEKSQIFGKNFGGSLLITLDGFITNSYFRTIFAPMDRYLDAAQIARSIVTAIIRR